VNIHDFIKRHQQRLHLWALIFVVVLYLARMFGKGFSLEVNSTIAFAVIAWILFDISKNTATIDRTRFFLQQTDLYAELEAIVDKNGARSAVLFQYSGKQALRLIEKLLSKNANVTLFLKNPSTAVSDLQKERIENTVKQLDADVACGSGNLTIHYYDPPGAIRAALIDKDILGAGWYLYEHLSRPDPNYPADKFRIKGHNAPGILCFNGCSEFKVLSASLESLHANFLNIERSEEGQSLTAGKA